AQRIRTEVTKSGTSVGSYELIFEVYYAGFEGRFAAIEYPIDVNVKVFPSYIRLFEDAESANSIANLE
ncbi:MAG: hypothetical protein IJW13_00195, partial [Clostridia bacterium]|nr:hypothetical protein [Clostridia bacterium]